MHTVVNWHEHGHSLTGATWASRATPAQSGSQDGHSTIPKLSLAPTIPGPPSLFFKPILFQEVPSLPQQPIASTSLFAPIPDPQTFPMRIGEHTENPATPTATENVKRFLALCHSQPV